MVSATAQQSAPQPAQVDPAAPDHSERTVYSITLWEQISFELARAWAYLVARTFSLTALYHVGRVFATLEWMINFKRRRRFAQQMVELFGDDINQSQIRRACLNFFIRTRNDKLLYLIFDLIDPNELAQRCTITNRQKLDAALSKGKGAYLAASHFGSHHLLVNFLKIFGYPIGGVRDPNEGGIRRFIQRKRRQRQTLVIPYFHNDTFPRELFRWYAGNCVLCSAMDPARVRDEKLKTLPVTMFGQPRPMLLGPIKLATRCGAQSLHSFLISRKNFSYEFQILGPLIDPEEERASKEPFPHALEVYARRTEQLIREYPCHISRI